MAVAAFVADVSEELQSRNDENSPLLSIELHHKSTERVRKQVN
jgi:hypothetical protein